MESRFHGVPISASQMAPEAATPYKGIRAPLTVDESEFEYSVSSISQIYSTTSSYYSGSELESEGFESGEDELESVPERAHVVEKGEGILEETHFVKEIALSDEEVGHESGNVSGNVVFRPFVRIPDGRIYKGSSNVDDSDDSESFLSESSDELVKDESYVVDYGDSRPPLVAVMDEEVSGSGASPAVDIGIPPVQKLHIPVALISADSDDDSQGSGVSDGEGFSGIVRVPSIEVMCRTSSAPIVRILETDEGDDNESQAEKIIEMEFVDDLVISNAVLGISDEMENLDVTNSIDFSVSEDLVQDKGPDIDKEASTNSLVVNEEFDSTSESGKIRDLLHLDEEIQEIDVIDEQKKCVELVDHREPTDLAEDILFPENVSDNENRNEKVESEHEHEIDPTVESFSCNAAHEIGSIHQCVDIKEVPTEGCPGFPESLESLTESMQVYMSDSLFKDASLSGVIDSGESVFECSVSDGETRKESVNSDRLPVEVEESTVDRDTKAMVAEMKRVPDSTSFSNGEILPDHSQEIDGLIVTYSHEEVDVDGGIIDHRYVVDPAPLATIFEAVLDGGVELAPIDGVGKFSLESNMDDLGSFLAARNSDNFFAPSTSGELEEVLSETKKKKKIEKIQQIPVKYMRLLRILGQSPVDSVASKVLYQLLHSEESSSSQAFHLDSTKKATMELEAQKIDDLDFSLSILVIGKTGVGKSATINSIFGERKVAVDAFEPATTRVKEIIGMIDGVKLKVFDTPGLRTSLIDQSINRKILSSIKKLIQKSPPDVVLYVDRLDTQTSLNDLPVLKSITSYLGSSIWRKSIIAFTHGTSSPPDGPNGYPLSYEVFVAQQSRVVQQIISRSSGELQVMNTGSMIPVCLVENHPFTARNGRGETLLHNGDWRSQLLLLCCSIKILSELSSVVMVQNPSDHRCPPYFLTSFLQPNVHTKLLKDQSGENVASDVELCYSSGFHQDEEMDSHTDGVVYQETGALEVTPSFRYRSLQPSSKLLTWPFLNSIGFNGALIEDITDIADHFPAVISVHLTKDRKEVIIQLHSSVSTKHGDKGSSIEGLDILTLGEKLTYTLKGETRIKNVVWRLKVEDHFAVGKRLILVGNAGIIQSHDDAAYGVNLDLCRRDEEHQDQTSLGLSIIRYRSDVTCGINLQSQFSVRNSRLNFTAAFNNHLCGKICVKTRCSDQLHIAALALVPIARGVFKKIFGQSTEDYST